VNKKQQIPTAFQ